MSSGIVQGSGTLKWDVDRWGMVSQIFIFLGMGVIFYNNMFYINSLLPRPSHLERSSLDLDLELCYLQCHRFHETGRGLGPGR